MKDLYFRYFIGHKVANGAFGQVRLIDDIITGEQLAVKLENSNAKMPMLFLEYRFYRVCTSSQLGFFINLGSFFYMITFDQ